MWTTRPSRTVALLAALAAATMAGCGTDPGSADIRAGGPNGTPTTGSVSRPPSGAGGSLPSIGTLPAPVDGGPAATVRTCEIDPADPSTAIVEAVVVNTSSSPRMMQATPVTVRDGSGAVVSSEGSDLWNSIRIGPGRRALLREDMDLDEAADEVTCELGRPDLRPEPLPTGSPLDPADLQLESCAPTVEISVLNPEDRPVAVVVIVEAFDEAGFSAGSFELGQRPVTYTDGREPGPDEVALPAEQTGHYEVDPATRISDYGTPLDGPVSSCEVLAARYAVDPETSEVIVD